MTFAQAFQGADQNEVERRHQVVVKMNILWDKRNACEDESEKKRIDSKLKLIRRQEADWLKKAAWFLY